MKTLKREKTDPPVCSHRHRKSSTWVGSMYCVQQIQDYAEKWEGCTKPIRNKYATEKLYVRFSCNPPSYIISVAIIINSSTGKVIKWAMLTYGILHLNYEWANNRCSTEQTCNFCYRKWHLQTHRIHNTAILSKIQINYYLSKLATNWESPNKVYF
jgi:hypothetical protein